MGKLKWKVCVLLVEFPDLPHRIENSTEVFANMFNQLKWEGGIGSSGSVRDYFLEVSYNKFVIQADVYGWFVAEHSYKYYSWDKPDKWDRSRELAKDVITKADPYIDYSYYDNDNDGTVEALVIIHAGPGAAENGDLQYIWPHNNWFNNPVATDGVKIENYALVEEIQYNRLSGIGMITHEFGHILGLPDLYDTDGSSYGVGNWCVMGMSAWLNYGRTPSHLCAWAKEQLGWITPEIISEDGDFIFKNVEKYKNIYKYPTAIIEEYFLIENRQKIGWDAFLPGDGLLIWHIDNRALDNSNENHKKVDLEEADGLSQLDNAVNRGDIGDPYPGTSNNRIFNYVSNPNSRTYDGANSGLNIENISDSSEIMRAHILIRMDKKGKARR